MNQTNHSENQGKGTIQLPKPSESDYVPPTRHEEPFKTKGRPNKITAEIINTLYDYVRIGMPKDKAAPLAGISEATYHNWMASARKLWHAMQEEYEKENAKEIELSELDVLYLELLEAVALAESEFIREGTQVILAEGPAGYKFIMSRILRSIYGDKMDVGVSTEPVQLTLELPNMIESDAQKDPEQIGTPKQ